MNLYEHIYSLLTASVPLVALVGDRIYPLVAPQDSPTPRVVVTGVDGIPVTSLLGFTSGLSDVRVQVDAYSKDFDEAQAVAKEVDKVLKSYISVEFSSVRVSRRDLYEDTTGLNRVSLDFKVWSQEE